MKNYIEKLSTTKCLLMLFGGFALICVLCNSVFRQDFVYLTQTFHYSSEYAYRLMKLIGESGRKSHLLILIADLFMVILYTNFFIGMNYRLSCLITKRCNLITIITFAPLTLTIVQLAEIIANATLIINYTKEYANLAHLANTLTIIKFYLTAICFGLPLVLFCVTIILKIVNKRKMKFEG